MTKKNLFGKIYEEVKHLHSHLSPNRGKTGSGRK